MSGIFSQPCKDVQLELVRATLGMGIPMVISMGLGVAIEIQSLRQLWN